MDVLHVLADVIGICYACEKVTVRRTQGVPGPVAHGGGHLVVWRCRGAVSFLLSFSRGLPAPAVAGKVTRQLNMPHLATKLQVHACSCALFFKPNS